MSENGLVGNYKHTLDSKNRVFFPAKFREDLGSPIVITVNTDRCLSAYSMNEWTKFVDSLKALPKSQVAKITRFFCGNALKCVPDGQGRVSITKDLLNYAGITESVTFVGCGDRVELWAEVKNPLLDMDDDFINDVSAKMMELDL